MTYRRHAIGSVRRIKRQLFQAKRCCCILDLFADFSVHLEAFFERGVSFSNLAQRDVECLYQVDRRSRKVCWRTSLVSNHDWKPSEDIDVIEGMLRMIPQEAHFFQLA